MKSSRIIVDEDGSLSREIIERVRLRGNAEEVFASRLLANAFVVTASLGSGPAFDQLRLALPFKGATNYYLAAARLPRLNFRAPWARVEGGGLTPNFKGAGAETDPEALPGRELKCEMPPWTETWLVMKIVRSEGRLIGFSAWLPTLLDTPGGWRWSRLPLPNLHNDGKLCFGSLHGGLDWKDLLKSVGLAADGWFRSLWNGDLFNDDCERKFRELFRWKDDGTFDPAEKSAWQANCQAMGVTGDPGADFFMESRFAEKRSGR